MDIELLPPGAATALNPKLNPFGLVWWITDTKEGKLWAEKKIYVCQHCINALKIAKHAASREDRVGDEEPGKKNPFENKFAFNGLRSHLKAKYVPSLL
jgi:hypothetical protein